MSESNDQTLSRTRSIVAMTIAGALARGSALISQVVVGLALSQEELGAYAIAVGITGFTLMLRGGGMAHFLPSIRRSEFDAMGSRAFWWSTSFRSFGFALTIAVAALLPQYRPDKCPDGVVTSMVVLASSQLLGGVATLGRMRMAVEQRFPELARLDMAIAFMRVLLTCLLAWLHTGVLALALPIAAGPVFELLYYVTNGSYRMSDFRWSPGILRQTAPMMAWPLVVAILVSLNTQANLYAVNLVLPVAALGVFYFAIQVAGQPSMFLVGPLTNVLATQFAMARGDQRLERQSIVRTCEGAILFISIVCFGIVATFPSLNRAVWGGKWNTASLSVCALASAGCWSTVTAMLGGPLAGLRRFRLMALFEALKALGILGGSLLGVLLVTAGATRWRLAETMGAHDTDVVGLSTALAVGLTAFVQLAWVLRQSGASMGTIATVLLRAPLSAGLAALAAYSAARSLCDSMDRAPRSEAVIELATVGVLYAICSIAVLRTAAPATISSAVAILPATIRDRAGRLLGA